MKMFADYGIELGGKVGEEVKATCPKCSHTRKKKNYPCLNVNTLKGAWHCWHCGWSGGLASGEHNRPSLQPHNRTYHRPTFNQSALSDKAIEFFGTRGITNDVLIRNRISIETIWMPQIEDEVRAIAFPYIRDGEVVNVKYRDNAKNFRQVGGAEKCLYKIDDVTNIAIITEGEMDALSLEVAGYTNAISVPDGAPAPDTKNYDTKFDYLNDPKLDQVETFIIAVDADAPGFHLEEELARRLGRERCLKASWPEDCKDANEVLMKHGATKLKECITLAKPFPVDGVFSVFDIVDNLEAIIDGGLPEGEDTGWPGVNELYMPCPGQWTLVTGIPSMGKSEWLDALAVNLAERAGWVFGVCSPENQPIDWHAAKLIEKRMGKRIRANGQRNCSSEEFYDATAWVAEHFHFILPERPTLDSVLDKARSLVRRHGMKGLIIDPYNELDHIGRKEGIQETEYVSHFLTTLRKFAREQGVHVWLVAHPSKLIKDKDGQYPVPDGYSVSGSAHFYNKADNIIAVHRDPSRPDTPNEVHVQKIRSRWLGKRGTAFLWWDPSSGRYNDNASYYR